MPSVNGTYTSADPNHPLHRLTPEQIDEIGEAFQAIDDEVRPTSALATPTTSAASSSSTAASRRSPGSS